MILLEKKVCTSKTARALKRKMNENATKLLKGHFFQFITDEEFSSAIK